jgi:hypothetical protein
MAKKTTDSVLVKAAERVGRTAGKAAKRFDKVTAAAKALTGRKKAVKKVAKKVAKKAKPTSTRTSRTLATEEALRAQHGALVDERAHTRATAGHRWAARKPR